MQIVHVSRIRVTQSDENFCRHPNADDMAVNMLEETYKNRQLEGQITVPTFYITFNYISIKQ